MKIGFSSITLAYDPFDWVYELEEAGFCGWEVVCESEMTLTKKLKKRMESVQKSTNLSLSIHAPFSDLNLASVNMPIWRESVKQIKSCIEHSSGIANIVTVHPGHLSPIGSQMPEIAWNQMVKAIQILCDYANDYDIFIAVENMINIAWLFGRHPNELTSILEKVDRKNVGITLDIGHANLMGLVDDFLKLDFIHIHAHDNLGKIDRHLPIGRGKIDWGHVLEGLKDYKGTFVIEVKSFEDGKESIGYINSI